MKLIKFELVPCYTCDAQIVMFGSHGTKMTDRELAIDELMDKYGIQIHKKRKRSILELDDGAFAGYKAGIEIAHCCKTLDIAMAYNVFKKCEGDRISLSSNQYTNLLCLVAGLGDVGSGSNQDRADAPQDLAKAVEIYDSMRTAGIIPSEAAFSAIIRCCCQNNQFTKALALYQDMKSLDIVPKLRCINSLIAACAKNGDTTNGFHLFEDITQRFHLTPSEKEYRNLLKACLKAKDVRFVDVFLQMMEELLVLSDYDTVYTLIAYFYSCAHCAITLSHVESATGIVQTSKQQLQSIDLDEPTRLALIAQIEGFATNRDPSHRYKLNNKVRTTHLLEGRDLTHNIPVASSADNNNNDAKSLKYKADAVEKWNSFKQRLSNMQENAEAGFNIIIDGANVGYYKQNFPNAPTHVDYHQINALFSSLVNLGYKPLLIIHSRHVTDGLAPQNPEIQQIITSWRESSHMISTPKGFNDDWFWLYAAIHYQLPVVTNDEMRDHHFQLLSPRYFMRWRERHRVPFDLFFDRDDLNVHDDELDDAVETTGVAKGPNVETETSRTKPSYVKEKIIFPPGVHRSIARFHFPSVFSHRMQYLNDGVTEGFYIPPLPHYPVSAAAHTFDEDCIGEEVKLFIRNLYNLEVAENIEELCKRWLAIYRLVAT